MIIKTFCRILSTESIECLTFNLSRNISSKQIRNGKIWKLNTSTTRQFASSNKLEAVNDENNIVKSPFPDVKVPNVPFSKFIWDDNAQLRGKNVALVGIKFLFKYWIKLLLL